MSKSNWACATCGMDSSRKASVKRHIKNLHSGIGVLVTYTDYLIGRQSGIYAQHTPPTYITENKPSLLDKLLDAVTEEYWKEKARQFARRKIQNPLPKQQQTLQPYNNNGNTIQHQPYDFWSNHDDIFGFEIKICNNCLGIVPVEVFFSQHNNTIGRSSTHVCNPSMMEEAISQMIIGNEEELANNLNHFVPMTLRKYVNAWTNNKNMLIGIEVPYISPNATNNIIDLTKRVTLQRYVAEERKHGKYIALPFSVKKCLDIDLTDSNRNTNELYHKWAERITKEKQTILNNEELMDFLEKVKNATFAFFRIEKEKGIMCYYFMAIIPANTTYSGELKLFLDNQSNSIFINQMQKQQEEQQITSDNKEDDDDNDIAELAPNSDNQFLHQFLHQSLLSKQEVMQNVNNISTIDNNNNNKSVHPTSIPVNRKEIIDIDLHVNT